MPASGALLERARKVIPGCSQTFSKGPTQFVEGVCPSFIDRGHGAYVWDVDGNRYIDYPTSLGPIILGHNDPDVNKAAIAQIERGVLFSLPHPLEVEVSELLVDCVPCAEMVRFGKNGSDVTSAAVRAARAHTGREKVACCGYHGWHDWYIGTTTRSRGVPESVRQLTLPFAYNDIASLERLFAEHPDQIACVIMEPVSIAEPEKDFLQNVAKITRRNGALLVFDEVVTGFRIAVGGGQEYYGVEPDLACFNKAIANGFPLSAVVGRRDIMMEFEEAFFSVTLGGEAVALAAAKATIEKIRSQRVVEHLWRQGRKLQNGYNEIAEQAGVSDFTRCDGLAPRTVVSFKDTHGRPDLLIRSFFQQEMARRGILFLAGFNISFSVSDDDVARTLAACREILPAMGDAIRSERIGKLLDGPPAQPVFRTL